MLVNTMAELLVVDDDRDVADVFADVLRGEGHAVRIANNGREGLHLVQERAPDLVLLDVEMPFLDGPGMAYRLFVENMGKERIPIVLLSGVADLHRLARQVGTPYFLSKPYQLEPVLALIERALMEHIAPVPMIDDPPDVKSSR